MPCPWMQDPIDGWAIALSCDMGQEARAKRAAKIVEPSTDEVSSAPVIPDET